MQAVSVSVAWAIAQYRQTLATLASRVQGAAQVLRPRESAETTRYFRAIGIGRNIDVYA